MVDLTITSIPAWALSPGGDNEAPPSDGAHHVVVGVGSGAPLAERWAAALRAAPEVTVLATEAVEHAEARLADALRDARVGVRVAIAGPLGACLRLRATALEAGTEDDELHVRATETGAIEVFCAHCSTATETTAGVDGVARCSGCGRDLVVYYHVSRRLGQYLGYQVDAETLPRDYTADAAS